jgi:hypothetical protein
MSFPENDRTFQSEFGKTFRDRVAPPDLTPTFIPAIAEALRRDFGSGPGAVKRLSRLLNANDRAVRNWFEGKNAPSGEHLVTLMGLSNAVLAAVLGLAGRHELLAGLRLGEGIQRLRDALKILERLESD